MVKTGLQKCFLIEDLTTGSGAEISNIEICPAWWNESRDEGEAAISDLHFSFLRPVLCSSEQIFHDGSAKWGSVGR